MDFASIAYKEKRNGLIFADLAASEKNPEFKEILLQLAQTERGHFEFWRDIAGTEVIQVPGLTISLFRLLRRLFGMTFVVRVLEWQEDAMIHSLRQHLFSTNHPRRAEIEKVVLVEEAAEEKLIRKIKEERVEFTGSIVLGLNDGLIELSGALTGFSFAFRHSPTVMLAGIILGISASLSMGSSAYLQARHEKGKDPQKAAIYTGAAYLLVVVVLVAPFALLQSIFASLVIMILSVITIVAGLSFYTAVIFSRSFKESFLEMFIFSIGTAIITLLIGTAARQLLGIDI